MTTPDQLRAVADLLTDHAFDQWGPPAQPLRMAIQQLDARRGVMVTQAVEYGNWLLWSVVALDLRLDALRIEQEARYATASITDRHILSNQLDTHIAAIVRQHWSNRD
jgi:hypothetical protein